MGDTCPLDEKCASQISFLLQPLPHNQLQEYFEGLVVERGCHGVQVRQDGQFGKGLHALLDFREGELVLKDKMLVGIQHASNKIDCLVCSYCFRFLGSVELQIGRRLYFQSLGVPPSNGCRKTSEHCSDASSVEEECLVSNECISSSFKETKNLPEDIAHSLMNGELKLPYSSQFPLPSAISCPGACGEAYYCSKLCAETDWETSHSLLCTGERSDCPYREALKKFIEHANETNDIFHLAAKVISCTILRYRKLKSARPEEPGVVSVCNLDPLSLLLEAWKPMSPGYKKRWWENISLPNDVSPSEEESFRMEIKELAFTSLQLLKAAIFDVNCEPLFSLEIYGNVIGMFELNNLDLVVPSPVEDYFLLIDALPQNEKEEAEKVTMLLLNALGEDYSVSCEGTAFYPLQSCLNHSCDPNAKSFKRDEDRDGEAPIVAMKPILKGQEITISYIDETLPKEERQAALADYGFTCRCMKCLQ